MADWINCPNCGAPVEPLTDRCPFCNTPYPRPRKAAQAVAVPEIVLDTEALVQHINMGIMTPNEARRRMGFPPV